MTTAHDWLPPTPPRRILVIEELATVVLNRDLDEYGLVASDVGAVVHKYQDGTAFEVEFVKGDGTTVAVATVAATDVRPIQEYEILHVRRLAA
jgi:hypothetical protein